MEFDYTTTTGKTFDEAVLSVQEEIVKAGMRVLYVHDIAGALAEKGFQRDPFKMVEFCNAKYANEFLNADIKIGLCLPCKINVYVKNEEAFISDVEREKRESTLSPLPSRGANMVTHISGMRSIILSQFFPLADLGEMPKEIDQIILNIIDNAK